MNQDIIKSKINEMYKAKKHSYLINALWGIGFSLFMLGVTTNMLNDDLELIDIIYLSVIIVLTISGSFSSYYNYQKKRYLLELYETDEKKFIEEIKSEKAKQSNGPLHQYFKSKTSKIDFYDTMLLDLGEKIELLSESNDEFVRKIKQIYGLYKYTPIVFFLFPVFVILLGIFDEPTTFYQEGYFWFTSITLTLIFVFFYLVYYFYKQEGIFILENYENNKKEVLCYFKEKLEKEKSRRFQTPKVKVRITKIQDLINLINNLKEED